MKQYTRANRLLAGLTFLVALLTYTLTLQPSVPFWDCGEFSAATAWQQVPHPPGAPLFLIVGRLFHMLLPGDPGWNINMISAVAGAVTAMLVYLITAKLIERWRPWREGANWSLAQALPTFGGALIAALAFTWSDTQWFNSVESEVYSAGNMLIALNIWLMMRWNERADKPGHERYLMLLAYTTGLAFGVHLLALLVIPAVAITIYFRSRNFTWLSFAVMLGITAVAFYIFVYQAPLQIIPNMIKGSPVAITVVLLGALSALMWWSIRNKKTILALSSTAMLLILLGFSTYAHILVRANAHPPMNENEPDTMVELVDYLGREQYGQAPGLFPRRYQRDPYYSRFYTQYGEWNPKKDAGGNIVTNEKGWVQFDKMNLGGELSYMFGYQIKDMYLRYLGWNFVGRTSDVQYAGVPFTGVTERERLEFIEDTGFNDVFPVRFFALPLILGLVGILIHFRRDWRMGVVYTTLFLLLGVVAALQQNQQKPQPRERDYFYVGSFMIFSIWIGIGVAGLAERFAASRREDEEENRESTFDRPIGMPVKTGMAGAVLAVGLLAAPINMVVNGWKFHDRSGNWSPWDFSYNILQSCEKDAILFTNGDNDTFPLWFLQDVAGIRRDVRIVNLSLGQTGWYDLQLKNERPWGALPVPISIPDNQMNEREGSQFLSLEQARANEMVTVDVPAEVMAKATNGRQTTAGTMSFAFQGKPYGEGISVKGPEHKLVLDILKTNKWKRPLYFYGSTQADVHCGMENFFRTEGLCYRIMPTKQNAGSPGEGVNVEVMRRCLMQPLGDDEKYSDAHYGFKFRNLNNPSMFYMEDHRRLVPGYRNLFLQLASYELLINKDKKATIATLDKQEQLISSTLFPIPYPMLIQIADLYHQAGASDKAKRYADMALAAMAVFNNAPDLNPYADRYPPEVAKSQLFAAQGRYDEAIKTFQDLQKQYPSDPNVRSQIDNLRIEKYTSKSDTAGAIKEIETIIAEYGKENNPAFQRNLSALQARLAELRGEAPPAPADGTATPDSGKRAAQPAGDSSRRDSARK